MKPAKWKLYIEVALYQAILAGTTGLALFFGIQLLSAGLLPFSPGQGSRQRARGDDKFIGANVFWRHEPPPRK
jgi:hypothetical protein